MSSGDVVLEVPGMGVAANRLSYRYASLFPGDDGGFTARLGGSLSISGCTYLVEVDVDQHLENDIGGPESRGAPLLDPSKTYDVIIKEH
jgi:hypothetical protein